MSPEPDNAAATADAPPGIDVPKVTAWCEEHIPGTTAPLTFTRVGHGRSNITFRVEDAAGSRFVLRRPPLGKLLPSAHDMSREHRVLAALSTVEGFPVPRPLGLCTDESVTGGHFYVMEHGAGRVVTDKASGEFLSPDARRNAAMSLVRNLAKLHAVDVDAVGLGDLGKREGFAERQVRRWTKQWEASKTKDVPLVEEVAARLSASIPAQTEVTVVHGDYRLDNAMIDDTGEIRAILDWELCTLGDPLADLGLLMVYYAEAGDEMSPLGETATMLDGFPSRQELIEEYVRVSGRDVTNLPYFRALGYWKLATILAGVFRRYLDNPANSGANPEALEGVIGPLAERAAKYADEAGI